MPRQHRCRAMCKTLWRSIHYNLDDSKVQLQSHMNLLSVRKKSHCLPWLRETRLYIVAIRNINSAHVEHHDTYTIDWGDYRFFVIANRGLSWVPHHNAVLYNVIFHTDSTAHCSDPGIKFSTHTPKVTTHSAVVTSSSLRQYRSY